MNAPLQWIPYYADCADDVKIPMVAERSSQPVERVFAVWAQMLCPARWCEGGKLRGDALEAINAALRIGNLPAVRAIAEAMQGLLLDGGRLQGWEKRRLNGFSLRPNAPVKPATLRKRNERALKKSGVGAPELDLSSPMIAGDQVARPDDTQRDMQRDTRAETACDVTPEELEKHPIEQGLTQVDVTPVAHVTPEVESEEEKESKKQDSGREGTTRAGARARSPGIDDRARKAIAKERWQATMLREAQATIPPQRFAELAVVLCEARPPTWARAELERLDRQVRQRRRSQAPRGETRRTAA